MGCVKSIKKSFRMMYSNLCLCFRETVPLKGHFSIYKRRSSIRTAWQFQMVCTVLGSAVFLCPHNSEHARNSPVSGTPWSNFLPVSRILGNCDSPVSKKMGRRDTLVSRTPDSRFSSVQTFSKFQSIATDFNATTYQKI